MNFGWYEWTAIVLLPIYLYGSLQSLWNFVHIASSGQTILVVTARQSRRNRSWIELRMLYVLYVLNWINVRVWLGRTKSVLEKFYLLIICGWEKNFNSWAMNFQLPLLDIAEFEDCVMLFGLPTNKLWSSFWCKECRLLPLNSLEEQDTQCLYLTIWVHEAKSSPFLSLNWKLFYISKKVVIQKLKTRTDGYTIKSVWNVQKNGNWPQLLQKYKGAAYAQDLPQFMLARLLCCSLLET